MWLLSAHRRYKGDPLHLVLAHCSLQLTWCFSSIAPPELLIPADGAGCPAASPANAVEETRLPGAAAGDVYDVLSGSADVLAAPPATATGGAVTPGAEDSPAPASGADRPVAPPTDAAGESLPPSAEATSVDDGTAAPTGSATRPAATPHQRRGQHYYRALQPPAKTTTRFSGGQGERAQTTKGMGAYLAYLFLRFAIASIHIHTPPYLPH